MNQPEGKDEGLRSRFRCFFFPETHANQKPEYWKRPRLYVPLSILLFAILSADYLFAVAGVGFFDFRPLVWIRVDPVDASAAGQVIGAAAASMGGAVALITLYVNLCEKRFAQEQTLEKDRRIARDQRENERNIAELQRLEEQFNQLSADFAGAELLARVNAGIGLAHIATTHRPGISDTEADARTEQNYPFYRRAANQLAAALHLYKEQPARDEVRKAIRHMGQFDTSEDQPLLHLLLNSLGEANRTAFRAFLDTLAEGAACKTPSFCKTCCLAVRICSDDGKNQQLLKAVVESEGCQALLPLKKHLATLPGNTGKKQAAGAIDGAYLGRLGTAWQSLAGTRGAIAELLKLRNPPGGSLRDAPEEIEKACIGNVVFELLSTAVRFSDSAPTGPNMVRCFLQGENLESAQLQDANLLEAQMQGVELWGAQMQGADLIMAQMQGAQMEAADLERAQMQGALLQGANLRSAQMQRADLRGAQMHGARLHATNFGQALGKEEWAHLKSCELGLPDFRDWRWDPSSEKVRPTDAEDTKLLDWLKANFPKESASIPDAEERFEHYRKWDEAAGVTMWVLGVQTMETFAAESTASEIVDAESDESDADE
ncbi:MAG: hypothetical protein DCC46_00160 [Armatimonadetes bacterium]|nr:MAG: hypothetical protein DCC46_00160 [Armatimonadota bacterium]